LRGTAQVSAAVRPTLGPRGRSVVIDRKYGSPQITTDGATIVRDLELPDHFENMGGQLLAEAARRTNDVAGDGTTTAALLAEAMVVDGVRNLAAGASPVELKRGIEKATKLVLADLDRQSRPLAGREDTTQVATISSGSHEIGTMIADAMERVTSDGVITVEESSGIETEVKVVDGMQFDRGFVSAYLVTDQHGMEAVLDQPLILVTPRKLSAIADIVPAMELAVKAARPLLVIAEDIDGEALATLVVNKVRGTVSACAVKAPGFGDRRIAMLQDLAVLTGAQVISEELGLTMDGLMESQLGTARRVVVTKDDTTVVEGGGSHQAIQDRVREIDQQMELTESDWDREKLQERKARLVGGVAVIKVGAPTETALKERKERVQDALDATRAAVAEGILPGGGKSLLLAAAALGSAKGDGDEQTGIEIVRRALEIPVRQLAANAGLDGSVALERVQAMGPTGGLDVSTLEYGDLLKAGIIDPTKVVKTSLQSAASVAALLLTTQALVADVPELAPAFPSGGGDDGMGDMGGMGG
ncbi:MAG: chaperonin GroEL, partial [Candidatus Dormiibacterota bacterium]